MNNDLGRFLIEGEDLEDFASAMKIVFKGSCATRWVKFTDHQETITSKGVKSGIGFTFQNIKGTSQGEFPIKLGATELTPMALEWLKSKECDYGTAPRTDGSVSKGWRISIYDYWTVLIEPYWMVYGK